MTSRIEKENGNLIIYHKIFRHEKFERCVQVMLELVQDAQKRFPDQPRILFLDIEGHRAKDGSFDSDMWEFISQFMLDMEEKQPNGGFAAYFTEAKLPVPQGNLDYKNPKDQRNDVPDLIKM
jgi:hypothetical protein